VGHYTITHQSHFFLTHLLLNPYNNLSTKSIRLVLVNGGELPKTGNIFERGRTYAGVMQVKITPGRYSAAARQPLNAGGVVFERHEHKRETIPEEERIRAENILALERPKHHGSQKRQLVPITGCVPSHIAAQLEQMRDQGGREKLSRSAVVADIVKKGVQQHVDMQYGATLEPIIEKTIERKIDQATSRTANLALEAFYAAEECRILTIYTLRFILGDADLLAEVIAEARAEARESLKRYSYASVEAPEYQQEQREVAN
jgi:hypothetical protein